MESITVGTSSASKPSLSSIIWGIDWRAHFPRRLGADSPVEVRLISYAQCGEFAARNYETIYGYSPASGNERFLMLESSPEKSRYYEVAGDFFGFFDGDKMVGMFVCTPVDWSTYHFRNVTILPDYQNLGLYQTTSEVLVSILAEHGVHRVVADATPSNSRTLHVLLKSGFRVTGSMATDRWGTLVLLTRYLSERHLKIFDRQFCHDLPRSARREAVQVERVEDERRPS